MLRLRRPQLRTPLATGAAIVLAAGTLIAASSCKGSSSSNEGTPDATASPQASAMPAPLAIAPTSIASAVVVSTPEGGPSPIPVRGDVALLADSLASSTVGYTLSAVMKPGDVSGPLRGTEVNAAGLDAARKKTELRLAIDLGASRMRVALLGNGWVLPADTELRSRSDRYGHVVVWPDGETYRPIAPGALRALIGERRFDVAPITPAEVFPREDVGKRIGVRTRRVEVATRAARATFEIGRLPDLGDGGILLCRMLLDLMNAPPSTSVCNDGELPMRAELRWTARGSIGFDVTGVLKKTDLSTSSLLVPPSDAKFAAAAPPALGVQPALTPPELAAFRTGPVEVATGPLGEGLVVSNSSDQLRVLHVDGIPVAWAAPGAKALLPGLHRGRYIVQSRTFLGETFDVPITQTVPGAIQLGPAEAVVR
jgi:hypothetical protein